MEKNKPKSYGIRKVEGVVGCLPKSAFIIIFIPVLVAMVLLGKQIITEIYSWDWHNHSAEIVKEFAELIGICLVLWAVLFLIINRIDIDCKVKKTPAEKKDRPY